MVFALHLDNFIMTRKSCPFIGTTPSGQLHHDTKPSSTYRDFAKTHANPDTDGNSLNRRAVSNKLRHGSETVIYHTYLPFDKSCHSTGLYINNFILTLYS
jgi:hypothetical protein